MLANSVFGTLALILILALFSIFRILREYERGVVFLLGRFYKVKGPGLIDCELYTQSDRGNRLILHFVNLTNEAAWRAPADELIPIGDLEVHLKLPENARLRSVNSLISTNPVPFSAQSGWFTCIIEKIFDHEVIVVELS